VWTINKQYEHLNLSSYLSFSLNCSILIWELLSQLNTGITYYYHKFQISIAKTLSLYVNIDESFRSPLQTKTKKRVKVKLVRPSVRLSVCALIVTAICFE